MKSRHSARLCCRLLSSVATAGLACLALVSLASAQERIPIPGTSVTLTAPPGFALSRDGKGVENAATGSSITIGETSAEAHAALAARFTSPKNLSAGYAAQGVTIRAVKQVTVGDSQVPFASGSQITKGKEFVKYLALLKGDQTVLVTFTIADRSFSEADAEAVVRSVELTPAPTLEERLAELSFTFSVVEPFHTTGVRSRTSVTLATFDGVDATGLKPLAVLDRAPVRALMGEEPQIAVELLRTTNGFRDAEVTEQKPTTFVGGNGYFVAAVFEDRTIVQYLRVVAGGSYLRLVARGETSAMEGAAAAIAEIAASVALK